MSKLLLIVGAAARSQLRWAAQHVYIWLALGPLILGATLFTASRVAGNLPSWQPSRELVFILATVFEALLIGINLSRASAEIYHLRRPESYFDALPVSSSTHLGAALIVRLARTTVVAVVVLIVHSRFGGGRLLDSTTILALVLFIILTALAEMLAAINWIHWSHRKDKPAASLALAVLLSSAGVSGALLALAIKPDYFSSSFLLPLALVSIAFIAALYFMLHRSHSSWRESDMEYARRLQSPNRWSIISAEMIERRFPPVVAAQLARDLQLTLRMFSSAVYVALVVFALWVAILVALLATGSLPQYKVSQGFLESSWLPASMAIKFACVFATVSLASLVSALIAYELPMMWLERATGVTGLDILRAKLWYARLVSLPAPVVIWAAGVLTGKASLAYAVPLLAECVMLWLLVSTVMGGMAFEIPNRPGLALIVLITMGLAAGLMSSLLWLVGVIVYFQARDTLTERGRHRVKYYLITEGD